MKTAWQTIPVPTLKSPDRWKRYLGETCPHGRQIALVDGTYVRNHFDSDFSQGGNGFRYRFISRKEIWIDRDINPAEWPYIAFHECTELEKMRSGMGYSRAHDQTKKLEDTLRHQAIKNENPMTKKKNLKSQPKLRGHTRELASEFIAEEVRTGKYPRPQAIAIGISRARAAVKKDAQGKKIRGIIAKYL